MKIEGYPKCEPDECFSSWIYRASIKQQLPRPINVDEVMECFDYTQDYDFSVIGLARVAARYSFDVNQLVWYFRPKCMWVLPCRERQVYCLECLKSDIVAGGLPCWRKSWCYLYAPICPVHKIVLTRMDQLDLKFDKAWSAFSNSAEWSRYDESCRNLQSPLVYNSIGSKAIRFALKAQDLIMRAHKYKRVGIYGSQIKFDSVDVLNFCAFVFNHVLYPRRPGVYYGIGRYREYKMPLSRFPDQDSALRAGCEDCDVFARVFALLLIGLILGVSPSQSLLGFTDSFVIPFTMQDADIRGIGELFHALWITDFRVLARHQLCDSSEAFLKHIRLFLVGLSKHVRSFSYENIMKGRFAEG